MSPIATTAVIARRELLNVVRSRSQLYSSMLTPLLFLVFLGTGVSRGLEPSRLTGGDFTAYLVAGTVVMTSVFSSTFSSASYFRDRDNGVLRLLLSTPHHPRVLLLGKSMASLAIGGIQSLAVLVVAAPFVDFEWQHGIPAGMAIALGAIVLVNLMLTGVAQVFASRIQSMQGFHLLMNLALFPLLFFSGAFFPIDGLPVWLRVMALANPLTYAVDALQLAAYAPSGEGFVGLPIDFAVLGIVSTVVYGLGLARLPRLTHSGQ